MFLIVAKFKNESTHNILFSVLFQTLLRLNWCYKHYNLKVKYSLVGRMIRWLFYIESHTATVENIARNLKWQLQDSCIDQASRQRTKS